MTGGEVAIILALTSAGVSAYSSYQQGQTASAQAKTEAAWHDYNAKVSKREAEEERKAVDFESIQHTRKTKQILARHRALRGISGVTAEGSPLLLAEDTAAQLAIEGANIRTVGQRRIGAFKSRSILDTAQAFAARKSAKGLRQAGALRAGASILQGGAQAAFMGSQMNN
jgi:predicted transcriptional regulator